MASGTILDAIGDTPLIELTKLQGTNGPRLYAKWEGANPTGSMKDRMAAAMVAGAKRDGRLKPGQSVVEYTGGSTGSSLALVCAVTSHPLHILTADCFSEEKIRTMRALGAQVEVHKTPAGQVYPGLIERWKKRVHERVDNGAYWTEQMQSTYQLEGYASMADEILADCPEVTDFVMSVGTGGCAMGTARRFREDGADVRVHLVEPAESPYLTQGEGGSHTVEGIAVIAEPPLLDKTLYQNVLAIPEADGKKTARRLAREQGLLAGTSTGLNIAAALRLSKELPEDARIVTVAVDTGLKYLSGGLFAME